MRIRVYRTRIESALSKSSLPGLDYALNPYLGCSHGCAYCYAREYTRDARAARYWGEVVVVKENVAAVLSSEVKRLRKGVVGVGTITDAYQPVEAIYRLTRECLRILLSHGFSASIQTKNPLVLRDIDILSQYSDLVDVGFTITFFDREHEKLLEPFAPPSAARASALLKLSEAGIRTWIFYGPIIPGLNDSDEVMYRLTELALETNSVLYYDYLHWKKFMVNAPWTRGLFPSREWRSRVEERLRGVCEEKGVKCLPAF